MKSCIYKFFKVLLNPSTTTRFPLLGVECISISLSWNRDVFYLFLNSMPILFALQSDLPKMF